MIVATLPWQALGLQGQWRRAAAFKYAEPRIAPRGPWGTVSLVGGVKLLVSAGLFISNLASLRRGTAETAPPPFRYALAVHPPTHVPAILNGFWFWNLCVADLMAPAYGFPILHGLAMHAPGAMARRLGGG